MGTVPHRRISGPVALIIALTVAACTAAPASTTGTTGQRGTPPATLPPVTATPVLMSPEEPAHNPPVVVLDPGHNGGNAAAPAQIAQPVQAGGFTKPCNTTGTATDAGYPEHAFAFDVVERAAALLRAAGVTVVLTRTDDSGVGPCVDARAAIANDAGAALAVSVHADGAAPGARGFHVIEPGLAPDSGNAAILAASQDAAVRLRTAFATATGQEPATYPGGLVEPGLTRRSDLAGLNLARVPALFIECANMRDPHDALAVVDPEWRQRAAQGLTDGVLSYVSSRSAPSMAPAEPRQENAPGAGNIAPGPIALPAPPRYARRSAT